MSVETPCRFSGIQAGAVIWYSTICAKPRRLSALTFTVVRSAETSMRSRLECCAGTHWEFWFQAGTPISPPNFATSSRRRARRGRVVSVCWVTTSATTAATFMSTMCIPLGPGGRERARPPQQLQLTPHSIGQVLIQIDAPGIGRERAPSLHDRGVDRHEALVEHAHRRAVQPPALASLFEGALQLGDGHIVLRAGLLPPHEGGRRPPSRPGSSDRGRGGGAGRGPALHARVAPARSDT